MNQKLKKDLHCPERKRHSLLVVPPPDALLRLSLLQNIPGMTSSSSQQAVSPSTSLTLQKC